MGAFRKSLGWIVVCVLGAACGGTTFTGADDAGPDGATGDSGGTNDSGTTDGGGTPDSGHVAACPPTAPTGGACPVPGAQCEYGDDPNPACNTLVICSTNGWSFPPRGGCAPPGSTCPASYASVPQGQKCTPEFLNCAYPEGTCECSRNGGAVSLTPLWRCQPTTAQCQNPRPHIGTPCTTPGTQCDYGACTNGVAIVCRDGIWQQAQVPCPV